MPLFICAKCGVIENTATSCYWTLTSSRIDKYKFHPDLIQYKGKPLCSECAKTIYGKDKDGNYISGVVPGEWHNKFEKKYPDEQRIRQMKKDGLLMQKW